MRNPQSVITWMVLVLVAVAGVSALLWPPLSQAFMANPVFNGMILAVLLVGIAINFRQVLVLGAEVAWIEEYRRSGDRTPATPPRNGLVASMARLLTGREGPSLHLSALSMRTLLDGIRSRLEESRDLSRYMVGVLIFIGLLGTFWGLLATLREVGVVIGELSVEGEEVAASFRNLKQGLQQPLAGMGTAFSSSLFGLAGALVLGFFDLQASRAQNRFYNDLEEWLAGQTRLTSGGALAESEQGVPAYIQALLEQTADTLDKLHRMTAHDEQKRRAAQQKLGTVGERIGELIDEIRRDRQTESETEQLKRLEQRLASIETAITSGRAEAVEELRGELRLISRTVAKLGNLDRE